MFLPNSFEPKGRTELLIFIRQWQCQLMAGVSEPEGGRQGEIGRRRMRAALPPRETTMQKDCDFNQMAAIFHARSLPFHELFHCNHTCIPGSLLK